MDRPPGTIHIYIVALEVVEEVAPPEEVVAGEAEEAKAHTRASLVPDCRSDSSYLHLHSIDSLEADSVGTVASSFDLAYTEVAADKDEYFVGLHVHSSFPVALPPSPVAVH